MANTALPRFLARLCWNDRAWFEPAGVADEAETSSYAAEHGFGFEEWLFNVSRCIEGWHYALLQPITRSRNALIARGETSISVLLWSKDPAGQRWYVGELRRCEIIDSDLANAALQEYKKRGWLEEMGRQVKDLGYSSREIVRAPSGDALFNVRFQPGDAEAYDPRLQIPRSHAIYRSGRYQLTRANARHEREWVGRRARSGPKSTVPSTRKAIGATKMTREHDAIQNHVFGLLKREYGGASVVMEEDWIDIRCDVGKQVHLIEIKAHPQARAAIREAIGQLLEYAFYRSSSTPARLRLHVVGPGPFDEEVREYLKRLERVLGLQVNYHCVTRETKSLRL